MDTIALVTAVAALLAALTTVVASASLRIGRTHAATNLDASAGQVAYSPEVLLDARSCLQVALDAFDDALPAIAAGTSAPPARQIVNLLAASPLLVFSEVIDDRVLASVEARTTAKCLWIITSDEWIEFEYPESGVSFAPVVLDNMRRGIVYRYLVNDTAATRARAQHLDALVRKHDLHGHLEIRFLTDRYFADLGRATDQVFILDGDSGAEMYYLFPGTGLNQGVRRWVRAPRLDAAAKVGDIRATWELAATASAP